MKRNIHLLGLLGLVALSSCNLTDLGPTYTLSGTVTQGRAQEAVAGATVTTNGGILVTTTDANGRFSFSGVSQNATVVAKKAGFGTSTIENVDSSKNGSLDIVMLPVYDPALATASPKIDISGVQDGDTVGNGDLTVKLTVTTNDPTQNPLFNGIASLEVPAGTSGTLNRGRVRHVFGDPRQAQQQVTFTKADFAAYKGDLDMHFVVYDLNGNRTDVIRHVKAAGVANSAAVVAPTDVAPFALTYGDNVTFGAYSVNPAALKALAQGGPQALKRAPGNDLQPQAAPSGKALWVDVDFNYAAEAPRAFELWRSTDGTNFTKVVSVLPATALIDKDTGLYRMRDTGGVLTPGVKTYYKVRAVSDAGTADSAVEDVTPLGAFNVKLLSPVQASTGVDRVPIFRWSATGASDKSYYKVIVFDRVQAGESTTAWVSDTVADSTEAVYNFDGGAALSRLQPYHAYDWQLAGITVSADEKAVSIGADYFNVFQLSPVPGTPSTFSRSGPVNEFVTGGL